jgi:hypothetical protein
VARGKIENGGENEAENGGGEKREEVLSIVKPWWSEAIKT